MSSGKTPPTNDTATTNPESRERSQPTTTTVTSEASKVVHNSREAAERETRRKSSAVEEKQRSKRLFGALLGSLNQSREAGGDRATKRRKEIEDRRKAELRRQDERDARDLQQKRDRLVELRRREKDDIDEQNVCGWKGGLEGNFAHADLVIQMRIRHRHMLDSANYLKTRAEPQVVCGIVSSTFVFRFADFLGLSTIDRGSCGPMKKIVSTIRSETHKHRWIKS